MAYPYTPPAFLENQSADEIHRRMLDALPPDIDTSEAQIPWDYTRPAALEKAEFVQFELNETIKLIFPHWAYDSWLDLHARQAGVERRPANKAAGRVTVKAVPGTFVPRGFQFATPAELTPSLLFEAVEDMAFDGEPDARGQVTAEIRIQAAEGGRDSNVPRDAIKLMAHPLTGIIYVSNDEPTTGGTPAESDDALRERVLEAMRGGISWVGCDADYVRWAKEVPAVGHAVVDPEWDDPSLPEQFHWTDGEGRRRCAGAVRLFIIDANGVPANEQILEAVYNHIVNPGSRLERLAPIGATVTVVAPSPVPVDVSALVLLRENENMDAVTQRFKDNLNIYWLQAAAEGSVKYVYVGSALAQTEGIANYLDPSLTVNGGAEDIPIGLGEFPAVGNVILNE